MTRPHRAGADSLGPAPEETAILAAAIEEHGWARGIERGLDALRPDRSDAARLSLNYAHTGWMGLFDGTHTAHAIGVDPGLGSVLIALARRFKTVTAFYRDPVLMRIVRARLDWLGITNVTLAMTSGPHDVGAVADGTVDAIVVYTREPATVASTTVRQYARALQRHGTLYVGIEGAAGGAFMARAAALRSRLKRRFDGVDWYRQHHGLMRRDEFVAVDVAGRPWWSKPRASLGTLRAPAFALVARAGRDHRSVSEAALDAIDAATPGSPGVARIDRYSMALQGGAVLAARAGERKVIIRMPFSGELLSRCERNAQTLCRLEHLQVGAAPRLITAGIADGQPFFAETTVPGRPLAPGALRSAAPPDGAIGAAMTWIGELHHRTAARCAMNADRMRRLVLDPFDRAAAIGGEMAVREISDVREYLRATLAGQTLPLVLSHGDYSIDNMAFDETRRAVAGVFDWDCSAEDSLPLLDALYLLFTAEMGRRTGPSIADVYRDYLFPEKFNGDERLMLDAYCTRVGVDPRFTLALMVMMWAYHALRIRHEEWYATTESSTSIVAVPMRAAAAAVRNLAVPATVLARVIAC